MKGEIIYKILNSLGDTISDQVDFVNAFLKAGYRASGSKINREFSKIKNKRINSDIEKRKIRNFQKYLSKLKVQGFIMENSSKKIYLSDKGKKKLSNLKNSFSLNKDLYEKKVGEKVVVVSYDIPVSFNKERNILRVMLETIGFNPVHKSVWVGKVLLPERFISDLSRLGIIDFVEILEVTKDGTLKSKN